ncbi:SRPBCC family protein [Arthrobacter sp. UYEF3]|uniref:SRPBCC family protein n=1 Tax=Arthrobacter sp. UYEF3 TaxID=1756365 RepID=UPI00339B2A35
MQVESTFSVVAPIGKVWDTLMDFERVAGCLPGARILNKLSDDAYQVGMSVKLGPVNMQYKGLLNVLERDAAAHRAVLGGKAQETRGQGTAEATVTLALTEEGATTRGTVNADLALSGKAAAMGKSVIGSVTEQMMSLFAANLQSMLAEPEAPSGTAAGNTVPTGAPSPQDESPTAETGEGKAAMATAGHAPASPASAPATEPSGSGTVSAPAGRGAQPAGSSLDAFSLAKGIAVDQLSSPGKVIGLLAAVACLAYWAGRRSAFRMLRLCGRL